MKLELPRLLAITTGARPSSSSSFDYYYQEEDHYYSRASKALGVTISPYFLGPGFPVDWTIP